MEQVTIGFSFASNWVLQPICRCLGLIGNIFCMAVLWKPSKEYQVYGYQLAIIANDICGLIAGTFWSTVWIWSNLKKDDGPLWARQNAFIMWYTAHISNLSTSIFMLGVCVLLTMTSFDRIWGMYFPISYQAAALKRRPIMIGCIIGSFLLCVAISFPDYFRQDAIYNSTIGTYQVVINTDFVNGIFSTSVIIFRQVVRFSCFLVVIIANIFIIWKYRQLKVPIAGGNRVQDTKASNKAKSDQVHHRTFTMLTIAQSVLLVIGQGLESIAYAMIYTGKDAWMYNTLEGRFFRDWVNFLDIAPYWANVFIFAAMSKGFRRLAKERLKQLAQIMKEILKIQPSAVASTAGFTPAINSLMK